MTETTASTIATEGKRLSNTSSRPLWIGLATVMLVFVGVGLPFGPPIYSRYVAIREIERMGGWVQTRPRGPAWLRGKVGYERMRFFDEVSVVGLENTQASDATLRQIGGLTSAKMLFLNGTRITDAGLVHLRGMTNLDWLDLTGTRVTDSGLEHLKALPKLEGLILDNTAITDAGLEQLKCLPRLVDLLIGETQVTDAGVAALQSALPCLSIGR
jgi:hypothetical protein